MNKRNMAASVRARLLDKARAEKLDFNLLLTRYALERLLYRLSTSLYADQFLLKGALLFDLWFGISHRPTRDADLLGLGSAEVRHIDTVFRGLCAVAVDDGIVFQPESVRVEEIRKEATYPGVRVTLVGLIEKARCRCRLTLVSAMLSRRVQKPLSTR